MNAIRPDIRKFADPGDMTNTCRKCGRPLVLLPDDMRMGYCFDCLDLLWTSRRRDEEQGRLFALPQATAPGFPGPGASHDPT